MRIVLLGPPGAGKGTQGQRLAARYELVHVDAGHIVRAHIAERTALGLAARPYADQRELLPDELVIAMLEKHLVDATKRGGYVLDGFPRKLQAQQWLQGTHFRPQLVLSLEVSN
ncbi:MAG TPA: nucleoside monophosphate kinase, partial [Streptosporangiaceae bacterium]